MTLATAETIVDVRNVAARDRHPSIFAAFNRIAPGDSIEIVNDHDPRPLYFQFEQRLGTGFAWSYVESGPDVWRVIVRKLATPKAGSGCCGACGGAN